SGRCWSRRSAAASSSRTWVRARRSDWGSRSASSRSSATSASRLSSAPSGRRTPAGLSPAAVASWTGWTASSSPWCSPTTTRCSRGRDGQETMNVGSILSSALSFAVALGVLVFVHELGPFRVPKRIGVLGERFSIGFGPVLFARRRGETEYAVSAVPMGGYVKMLGEEDDEAALANTQRAFPTQAVGRRAAIVFAGPAMNFVFAFL